MKKTISIMSMIFIVMTAGSLLAQQQPGSPEHHTPGQQAPSDSTWRMPPWMQNMPQEKQDAFKKIYETRTKTIYPLVMQLKARKAQLMAELAQENVDRKAVDQALSQMNELHSRIAREHVDLMIEVKTQFPEALMHGMGPGMGMGMGRGMGMGMMGHGMGMGMMDDDTGYGGCPMMGGGMAGGHGMMGGQGMMGGGMRGGMRGGVQK